MSNGRVPLAEVGRRGRLELRFSAESGKTILKESYCETPFKITRPHRSPTSDIPHLILMQCTAGLFGGDSVECVIRVDPGSRARITQQAATKIHPSEDRPAEQQTKIFVGAGAELQMFLEPSIPFADSRLRQKTHFEVEPGARLLYWEGFMAGRIGHGETWQFKELVSETSLRSAGNLVFLDRFRLVPEQQAIHAPFVMGDHAYAGTGLYFGPDAESVAEALHSLLPAAGVDTPAPNTVIVRITTADGPEFHRASAAFAGISTSDG